MINYVAIGQRVKEYRIKARLTQSELAEALDVSTGYISQIECGHTQVSLNRLDSIASIINTKMENLIFDLSDKDHQENLIIEITKNWTSEQSEMLLSIVNKMNKYFSSHTD
ncbi:MAG: helix-turn-helix transcriptional regulator [Oscillospiraceae bacterium]|nr:helix-turn-helix transcriptional regulator [Oscillospiraceae bacterium]